jgi:hypothetical protein
MVRFREAAERLGMEWATDSVAGASLWVAAPVATLLAGSWIDVILAWLSLSGGALLAQKFAGRLSGYTAIERPAESPRPTLEPVSMADAPPHDMTPVASDWADTPRARPAIGLVRHVDAVAKAAIAASRDVDRQRGRAVARRESVARSSAFSDREVPRPPSVTPLADRVRAADELFDSRRRTPPQPPFDGTVWQ